MSRKSGSIGLRLRRGKSVSQARGEDVFALLYDNSGQSSAGAVVESSVELTPSPHGSFLRHYHSQFAAVIPNSRRNKLAQKAEELALMRDVSKAAQEIDVR